MSKRNTLLEGASLLDRVMVPHGFAFQLQEEGRSSGGQFARGVFVSGDRRLELHLRHSLGLVTYQVGTDSVSHEGYMDELGVGAQTAYPGFSDSPLDGFKGLAHDLERFAADFLSGDGSIVVRAAKIERGRADLKNRERMAGYAGDVDKRTQAKQRFQTQDWKGVVILLESLKYPDQMNKADEKRLELARLRSAS